MTSSIRPLQQRAAFFAALLVSCATGITGCGDGQAPADARVDDAAMTGDAGTDANVDDAATTGDAGTDAGDASTVEPCAANTYVSSHTCVACPAGTENAAGDDPASADTTCDPVLCLADAHVVSHACVACAPGETRPAGDDATGADTACAPAICEANFHVVDHACVACAPGSLRDAGDDATGADTSCTATLCGENFHVVDHACVACASGLRPAGDDATGADTACCGTAWGAGASVGSAAGEFQDAFVTSTSASSLSMTTWTALSVRDANGTPGAAYWVRSTTGDSPGAYYGGFGTLDSPSMANGVALFDSDFLDNGGTAGAFGTGSSPSPHRGELISPPIDLGAQSSGQLVARVFNWSRNFQITELSMAASIDGGATWGTPASLPVAATNQASSKAFTSLALGSFAASTDLSNVRVRFVFDGDYYFAMVDDVSLYLCQ